MQDSEHPEVENNDLHSETAPAPTELLTETNDILSSLNLGTILDRLGQALGSFIPVSGLSLKLVDLTEELLLVRRDGAFKQETIYGSRTLGAGSFGAEALESGTPVMIPDLAASDYSVPSYVSREEFCAVIAVPLISASRNIGILTVYLGETSPVSSHALAIVSIVANVTAAAVENCELVKRIEKNYFSTVEALAAAIEVKDPYTLGHSKRVTQFAILLAERLGVGESDLRNLQYGATLHDIGKIGVAGEILNKEGRLTHPEYEKIKEHPLIGDRIIERVDFLQGARPIVRHHHERYDGRGYPGGLKGEEIPFLARVVAIVDFFDALTSDRPYRKAYTVDQTVQLIAEGMGREFDPTVAKEFLQVSSLLAKPAAEETVMVGATEPTAGP
jgi:putative nucleotidyltransferase with HDIG domain